jgi:light-independent protochlorophyllide reductase subunit B
MHAGPSHGDHGPRCNLLGPTALGFRHRDDVAEITGCWREMGVDGERLRAARRHARPTWRPAGGPISTSCSTPKPAKAARWLERNLRPAGTRTVPIGVGATRDFIAEVAQDCRPRGRRARNAGLRQPW